MKSHSLCPSIPSPYGAGSWYDRPLLLLLLRPKVPMFSLHAVYRSFAVLLVVLLALAAGGCAHGRGGGGGRGHATVPSGYPVQDPALRISSRFGDARDGGRSHKGIDLEVPMGTPVHATADGVVSFSGEQGAYGQIIVLDHADGVQTAYAHLSRRLVKQGAQVAWGEIIGKVGRTGNATAPHCHYEVRRNGLPVNPARYLN